MDFTKGQAIPTALPVIDTAAGSKTMTMGQENREFFAPMREFGSYSRKPQKGTRSRFRATTGQRERPTKASKDRFPRSS